MPAKRCYFFFALGFAAAFFTVFLAAGFLVVFLEVLHLGIGGLLIDISRTMSMRHNYYQAFLIMSH